MVQCILPTKSENQFTPLNVVIYEKFFLEKRVYKYLFVREDINSAFDTLLPVVRPGVAAHPFALAFGTLVLAEAPLLTLVRRQALAFWSSLELKIYN
jgi:hypothetical protein